MVEVLPEVSVVVRSLVEDVALIATHFFKP
jgi:hypothetical protein